MKQRLLLDWIHLAGDDLVINQGIEFARVVVAHTAGPTPALGDAALVRAQGTDHPTVWPRFVEPCLMQLAHSQKSSITWRAATAAFYTSGARCDDRPIFILIKLMAERQQVVAW